MADANVGNAYVGVVPRVEGSPESVGEEMGSRLGKGAKGTFGAGAVMLGNILSDALTSAASSVGQQLGKTFWNYADYEQLVGGVDKLFGSASDKVQQYASEAYKTSGLSANQYMQQATMFSASLLNDLGGDTAKAAEMADVAMRAMSDNVNTFGSDAQSVQNAIQGMARGEYTMLDNLRLGYSGSKAGMQELIKDANEYAKSQGLAGDLTIDSFADQIQAIELIQEKQGIAGTTAKEAASTVSGSITMLTSAWDNFLTAIGDGGRTLDLSDTFGALLDSLGAVASNVAPALYRIGEAVAVQLPAIMSEALSGLPGYIIETVSNIFGTEAGVMVASWIAPFESMAGRLQTVFGNVVSVIQSVFTALLPVISPIVGMLGTLFVNAAMVITGALTNVTGFLSRNVAPVVSGVLDAVAPVVDEITGYVTTLGTSIENLLGGAFNDVLRLAEDVWPDISSIITDTVSAALPVVRTVFDGIKTVASTAFGAVRTITEAVWPAVSSAIKAALGAARDVVDNASGAIRSAFNALRNIVSGVRSTFNAVKKAITDPINTAKNAIESAIGRIQSIINGAHLSLPHFKLPHFNINGGSLPWGIGGKGTPPSISVDWYAKGGIIDDATLIGAGERGAELIWPAYDPYMSKYAEAIARNMPDTGGITINLNYDASDDANDMLRDISSGIRQLRAAGAI